MSRTPEALQQPDWYQLALIEIARIPEFTGREAEIAQCVADTIRNAEPKSPWFDCTLRFGRKELRIKLSEGIGRASTSIDSDWSKEKMEYETTIIYMAAKLWMQHKSDITGKTVRWQHAPTIESLKKWARGNGAKLFDWEHDSVLRERYNAFVYTFKPRSNAENGKN